MKQYKTIADIIRYAIVGGCATAIHYGIYLVANLFVNANISFALGFAVSLTFNYILSAHFTFKKSTSVKNGIGFCLAHGFSFIFDIGLLNFFLWIGIEESFAPLPVYCISVPLKFLMVRFVFKKN